MMTIKLQEVQVENKLLLNLNKQYLLSIIFYLPFQVHFLFKLTKILCSRMLIFNRCSISIFVYITLTASFNFIFYFCDSRISVTLSAFVLISKRYVVYILVLFTYYYYIRVAFSILINFFAVLNYYIKFFPLIFIYVSSGCNMFLFLFYFYFYNSKLSVILLVLVLNFKWPLCCILMHFLFYLYICVASSILTEFFALSTYCIRFFALTLRMITSVTGACKLFFFLNYD